MNYVIINQEKNFKDLEISQIQKIFTNLTLIVLSKHLNKGYNSHMYYSSTMLTADDSIICLN